MVRNPSAGVRSFFDPRSVAVAGVSNDPLKLGSIIFANLCENADRGLLKASVYALNPAHSRVAGRPCYPTIGALPEVPEMLVIAVPVSLTLDIARQAADAGVKALVMVTSGFAEAGREELEREIGALAASSGMRVLGPNTIGLLDTRSGVDTLFLRPTKTLPDGREIPSLLKPLTGDVAIITQSGHLGEIVSEALAADGVGIRALVGTGNQLDVSVEDVLDYFADDEATKVIALYLEGVSDGRGFMRAAARAVKKKPVVVFKVGKTGVGARAALTHTASLVGDYQVYQAAFRKCGLVEATGLQEIVDYSVSFSMLPAAPGRRLVVITNAGGVGAIAADEAEKSGLAVPQMSRAAERRLRSEFNGAGFVSNAALGNPIDLTASVTTEEFVRVAEFALGLPEFDSALLLPTHQAPSISHDISARLAEVISRAHKPTCVCVMGQSELAAHVHGDFLRRRIPSFPTPERAVRALSAAAAYRASRTPTGTLAPPRRSDHVRSLGRFSGLLPHPQAEGLLRSYGIEMPKSSLVLSIRDLGRAEEVGFPVACKLLSKGLIHKTEAGGVVLGVRSRVDLASAFSRFQKLASELGVPFDGMLVQKMVPKGIEMILGGTRDPAFGPTVLFGAGGTYAELLRDHSVAVAPVTRSEAGEMVGNTKMAPVLKGYRGGPSANLGKLFDVISRFSRIMVENPSVEQMEVNPLTATEKGVFAIDARVIMGHAAAIGGTTVPAPTGPGGALSPRP